MHLLSAVDGSPSVPPAQYFSGRPWAFLGDSITNRSAAASGRGYIDYLPPLVGTVYMSVVTPAVPITGVAYSVNAGVVGERSDQILARLPDRLTAGARGVTLLAGTNDASQGVSTAVFMANIASFAALCRAAGVPLVVGTVPPRGAGASSAIHQSIVGYNLALRAWAPGAGVQLAEVHSGLVDTTSGAMLAAYDSGDTIHPTTAGHRPIAIAFAAAIRRTYTTTTSPVVTSKTSMSLITNPLMTGTLGAGKPSSWFEQPSGTGTAPTYSIVADTTSRLPTGAQWAEMYFDGTSSGGVRSFATAVGSTWSVGDVLLVAAQLDLVDVTGFATAANADPATGSFKLQLTNQSGTPLAGQSILPPLSQAPGDMAVPVQIPVGTTSMALWLTCTVPTGAGARFRISTADVRNLTTLGVTGF